MKKTISEVLENHTNKNTFKKNYWIENIEITVNQEGNKVVMWAFNHDTERFVNLGTKKYTKLIEGFKEVSSDLYFANEYCYITLADQHQEQEGSTENEEYINKLLKQIEELKSEVHELKNENRNLRNDISDINDKYLKLLVSENKEVHKIKNERNAGRKQKLNDSDIENIKMYRLQGKTIKDIAKIYGCSVGLIHKLINEKVEK